MAFFAASTVGVTLRTPDSAPTGFDFETGADFVSPAGFAVSLTSALPAGGAIGGAFEVVGQYAGYSDATIPLRVMIEALAAPSPDTGMRTAPVSGAIFDFADGDYQHASFDAVGASSDLTVYQNGRVETTRELDAGIYEITVLAHSSPDYLGDGDIVAGIDSALAFGIRRRLWRRGGERAGRGRGGVGFGGVAGGGRPGDFAGGSIGGLIMFRAGRGLAAGMSGGLAARTIRGRSRNARRWRGIICG